MSLIMIVPEDGSIEPQELQYLPVKRGSNVLVTMKFYKDKFHVYPWDLAGAGILTFGAKRLKSDTAYVIYKEITSPDWDLSLASTGVVTLILDDTDLADAGSLYVEVDFQPDTSARIYKTADAIIDVLGDVENSSSAPVPPNLPQPFSFTATAGQTAFVLPSTPLYILWLAINGVVQCQGNGDFTFTGKTITLSDPVGAGDKVYGEYKGA